MHVDHRIALAGGGKHEPGNLQILVWRDNLRKGIKREVPSGA
jgi:5-methylcytosine-specific restriction endonuclease McrA